MKSIIFRIYSFILKVRSTSVRSHGFFPTNFSISGHTWKVATRRQLPNLSLLSLFLDLPLTSISEKNCTRVLLKMLVICHKWSLKTGNLSTVTHTSYKSRSQVSPHIYYFHLKFSANWAFPVWLLEKTWLAKYFQVIWANMILARFITNPLGFYPGT
jgi:hypothetical protein